MFLYLCRFIVFAIFTALQAGGAVSIAKRVVPFRQNVCDTSPNDPTYSSNQWAYEMISLEKAWDISIGSRNVNVAIIDSGVMKLHNDLVNNCASYFYATYDHDSTCGTNSWYDSDNHGTRVAGILGAEGNNDLGVCGVCWKTSMVPLSCYDTYGLDHDSYTADAISTATLSNIPIINFSMAYSDSIDSAIETNIRNYNGLFVCSAGNTYPGVDIDSNTNINIYPSELTNIDNLISVGALASDGTIYPSSCYGATSVDLFAPGDDAITTTNVQNSYSTISQTSCAAPFVAGTAALLKSINPSLTTAQLKSAILDNVDVQSNLIGKCVTGGRLNAFKAAQAVIPFLNGTTTRSVDGQGYNWVKIIIDSPSTYTFSLSANYFSLSLTLSTSTSSYVVPLQSANIESGQASCSITHTFRAAGTYYLRVKSNNTANSVCNYTLTSTFDSYHYHSFNGPIIPIDGQYHGRECVCGEIGMIMTHIAKPNNPNVCFACGGYIGFN